MTDKIVCLIQCPSCGYDGTYEFVAYEGEHIDRELWCPSCGHQMMVLDFVWKGVVKDDEC